MYVQHYIQCLGYDNADEKVYHHFSIVIADVGCLRHGCGSAVESSTSPPLDDIHHSTYYSIIMYTCIYNILNIVHVWSIIVQLLVQSCSHNFRVLWGSFSSGGYYILNIVFCPFILKVQTFML